MDSIGDGSGVDVADTFQYDRLGRLTQYAVSGGTTGTPASRSVTLQYNALGMLLHKSGVGNYSYPAQGVVNGRPHALQSVAGAYTADYAYDLNGNATGASAGKWRSIAYTSFNLPNDSGATGGIAGAGGAPRSSWQYDENQQRIKETHVNAVRTRSTWYLHPDNQGGLGFERQSQAGVTSSNRHYLSAGGVAFGVIVTTGAVPTLLASDTAPAQLTAAAAVKLEYWHKDHLGSLIATTDHAANVTARYAYDPFGKRRYTTSTYDAFGDLIVDWTTDTNHGGDRGYTGHEHLDDLGLIHMNGRIYDPTLGRFMQADPFIQDPGNLQNYDRYAYCFNSPLICTDPSGYFSLRKFLRTALSIAVAVFAPQLYMAFGATAGGALLAATGGGLSFGGAALAGFMSGAIASGTLKGGLQGMFSAMVFYGIGQDLKAANLEGSVAAVMAHGVAGCVTSVASGGKCGPGLLSAAFSKWTSQTDYMQGLSNAAKNGGDLFARVEGAIVSSLVGGTASVLGGAKFGNGATTAAMGYLFNELMRQHDGTEQGRRLARQRSGYEEFTYSDGTVCNGAADPSCGVPKRDSSNEFSYDRRHCVTAECAAGVRPAPSENRTQAQIDYGQCKLVCNIAGMPLTITGNALAGGGSVGTLLGFIGKKTVCAELVCTKP